MAGDKDTRRDLPVWCKDEMEFQYISQAPKFPSLKIPNNPLPALLSSAVQTVSSNIMLAIQPLKNPKTELLECLSDMVTQKPISPLPFPYLALNNISVSPPHPISSISGPQKAAPCKPQDLAAREDSASEKGEVASSGPAFIGQVYTMCDASRRGLIAVRPSDVLKTVKLPPYMPTFLSNLTLQWMEKVRHMLFKDDMKGPVFRFYFDREDATDYVRRLNLSGSAVGSCPLDTAYKYFKSKQGMFKFVADREQVKVAKNLVRKERGERAAKRFKGIPVFTARNLTIAMSTAQGVRWFRPYFFNKGQLDSLIGHSVDHYYHMLIHARRAQRHSQIAESSGDSFGGGEPMEDELDGLVDPPEVQELMDELGQGGGGMEFVVLKVLEAQMLDLTDRVLLGHPWGRRLIGLQPRFPVIVDSFERRAAAAEVAMLSEPKGRVSSQESPSTGNDEAREQVPASQLDEMDESASTSGRDEGSTGHNSSNSVKKDYRNSKSPFNLFGKKWGINPNFAFKGKDIGDAGILEEDSDSEYLEEAKEPQEGGPFQPKLTMMGIAMNMNKVDGGMQQAMAAAAKDIEDRVRKGEGTGREHGPLFIANLGAPPEAWGRDMSGSQGWEAEESE